MPSVNVRFAEKNDIPAPIELIAEFAKHGVMADSGDLPWIGIGQR